MILIVSVEACPECTKFKATTREDFVEYMIGVTESRRLKELGESAMAMAAMNDLMEMPILADLHEGEVTRVGKPEGEGGVKWL